MREYQVRICERLGVQFPGPTRQNSYFALAFLDCRGHGGKSRDTRTADRSGSDLVSQAGQGRMGFTGSGHGCIVVAPSLIR